MEEPLKEFSEVLGWQELENIALAGGREMPDGMILKVVNGPFDILGKSRTVKASGDACATSFCYRTLVPVILQLGDFQQTVLIADERSIWGIDLDRAALVQTKMDLTFMNGVLTGVEIDKPSTLLAAASLPLTILKAILTVPTEILRFRIDYDSAKEGSAKQELATIKAQEELKKAKEASGSTSDPDKAAPPILSPLGI
ncbi:hypothetical protein D3867_15270 (plasmid) [Azospirillum argentinense]|uniref:Uncharacterized protein n=1 Tax=Azospirillum brasilense TaxID=192 RepID=A0A4D8QBA6_AZOBR|nr:hypothetical protein D3867_15270 [Azospirillum argentinense]